VEKENPNLNGFSQIGLKPQTRPPIVPHELKLVAVKLAKRYPRVNFGSFFNCFIATIFKSWERENSNPNGFGQIRLKPQTRSPIVSNELKLIAMNYILNSWKLFYSYHF